MVLTVKHTKTTTIPDWTQTQVDAAIAAGQLPPGSTPADVILNSDWNNDHTIVGTIDWTEVTGKPTTFTPAAHTHAAADITDSTAAGRSLLTAANAAAQRTALALDGASTATFNTLGLNAATNQIVLDADAANTGTITTPTLTAARTWTFPNSSGTIVLTASVGNLQNKTLDNTNTISLFDSLFTLQDNGDATKQAQFQLSGLTTATTRTLTLQDVSGTVYVSGGTDIPLTDGGTGASDAAGARTNLGLGGAATLNVGTTAGTVAAGNHTHVAANITDFAEAVDDEVASLLVAGSGISLSYNDAANTLTITNTGGGGSPTWGSITGTLSSQTDLQTALNAKQDTLVSGTNIRTINGSSILGSGDLVVSGGGGVARGVIEMMRIGAAM